jgi:hypothetical protein
MYRCRVCQQQGKIVDCNSKGNLMTPLGNVHAMGLYHCSPCPYVKCRKYVAAQETFFGSAFLTCMVPCRDQVQAHIHAQNKLHPGGRHRLTISHYSQRMRNALHLESDLSLLPYASCSPASCRPGCNWSCSPSYSSIDCYHARRRQWLRAL